MNNEFQTTFYPDKPPKGKILWSIVGFMNAFAGIFGQLTALAKCGNHQPSWQKTL